MKYKMKRTTFLSAEGKNNRQDHLRSGPLRRGNDRTSSGYALPADHFEFSVAAYRNLMNAVGPMGLFF
jgi:hypothetical protein